MPESDFIQGQIAALDTRTPAEKLGERVLVAVFEGAVYGLLLLGMALEDLGLLLAYLAAVAAAIVAWVRLPATGRRIRNLFRRNAGFARLVLVVLLIAYPFIFQGNPYLIHLGALAAIFAIMALGLNISLGFCGLLDVGFAVYFAAGAYASSQLAVLFGWSFWIGLPLGGLVAAFFGFLVAWPALRVHDHYLALVTLGYGLIMNLLHRNLTFLTNGTDGVINIPPPAIGGYDFIRPIAIGGFNLPFQANFYYLALALAGITVLVSVRLRNSNLGRQWEAIREEEVAARCFGINVTARKVVALTTGAFFGGIGGATFAHMIGFVHPDNFVLLTSITILAMVIIGGMGNIYGVIVGAVLLTLIPERLREFQDWRMLLFGVALVLIMIFRPQGLFPSVRRRRELDASNAERLMQKVRPDEGQA